MMMIMTVCFANREYCILLFLKDSFSITLEPNVTIHWFFLCACDRVHVCRCEVSGWGACACVWVCVCVVHQTFCMCTRVRKTIFRDMTWMHIKQKGVRGWGWGGTRLRELPLLLCLKLKLLPWCSGMRRLGEEGIRAPGRRQINIYHRRWQAGLTDWKERVSNMPPYASDAFEKLAVKGRGRCSWGFFHPAGICLTFKKKKKSENLPSSTLYL